MQPIVKDDEDPSFDVLFDPAKETYDPDCRIFYTGLACANDQPLNAIDVELAAPATPADIIDPKGCDYNPLVRPRRGALKGTRSAAKSLKLKTKKVIVPSNCPFLVHLITTVKHDHVVPESEGEIEDGFLCALPEEERYEGNSKKRYPPGPRERLNIVKTEAGEILKIDERRANRKVPKVNPSSKGIARSLAAARRKANMLVRELKIPVPEGKLTGRYVHAAVP